METIFQPTETEIGVEQVHYDLSALIWCLFNQIDATLWPSNHGHPPPAALNPTGCHHCLECFCSLLPLLPALFLHLPTWIKKNRNFYFLSFLALQSLLGTDNQLGFSGFHGYGSLRKSFYSSSCSSHFWSLWVMIWPSPDITWHLPLDQVLCQPTWIPLWGKSDKIEIVLPPPITCLIPVQSVCSHFLCPTWIR